MLGSGYRALTLDLGRDAEGSVIAVLVHRGENGETGRASTPILVLHGWSDYVFQRELLEHLAALGLDVWALDLRKHGRSLRAGQTATAVDALEDYDAEIDAALARIGGERRPLVLAHSTGGLVAALWSSRHPGALRGLILNSPWLEMHGGPAVRGVIGPAMRALARARATAPILPRGADHYARSLHLDYGGAFDFDLSWKPPGGHPFPASTLSAVLAGQRRLARARVREPVLVLCSDRSRWGPRWRESMRRSDVVLDVRSLRRAAGRLGPDVDVRPLAGARHDVFLSDPDVVRTALDTLDAWIAERRLG